MTPEAWTFLGALVVALFLLAIYAAAHHDDARTIEGLRDQLRAESDAASHWFRIARGLPTEHRTPDWLPERPSLTHAEHIADAIERVEFGPVEAARRGMSLPGAEVVELRPKGGAR